jgi:cytidine deaminase
MEPSDEAIAELVLRAQTVRRRAYAPYSNYPVGAAVLGRSGQIYEGANVENAAYPTSMCAERNAIFRAVSDGERGFDALAVVTENGGTPCGACRQVLSEFGSELLVITADASGKIQRKIRLNELIPHAFGPQDLVLS